MIIIKKTHVAPTMSAHAALRRGPRGGLWQTCIGLEVHAQIAAASKLFSRAPTAMPGSSAIPSTINGTSSAIPSGAMPSALAPPNSLVDLFDAAHPGTLPRLNGACVAQAVRAGIALRGRVHARSCFERKHYFYADLPHGYQITQLEAPIVSHGVLRFRVPLRNASGKRLREPAPSAARIMRVQLEMDSGKSVHTLARGATLIDLNRAGVGLLEIVSAPDLRSADEAAAFVTSLQALLRHVGVSPASLEDGSLRCDVNVSVRPAEGSEAKLAAQATTGQKEQQSALQPSQSAPSGSFVFAEPDEPHHHGFWWYKYDEPTLDPWADQQPYDTTAHGEARASSGESSRSRIVAAPHVSVAGFGPRVEIKNLNSLRAVVRAIEYEAQRQVQLNEEGGGPVVQETRSFDVVTGETARSRSKEDAVDYRFMPEPDLRPILLTHEFFEKQRAAVPPLLEDVRAELITRYGLSPYDATVLIGEPGAAAYYKAAVAAAVAEAAALQAQASEATLAKATANWVCNELFGHLGDEALASRALPASHLGQLVALVEAQAVSGRIGKQVLSILLEQGGQQREDGTTPSAAVQMPKQIVETNGWWQNNDAAAIQELANRVLLTSDAAQADTALQDAIAQLRGGRTRVLGALVARVLEAAGGLANPAVVSDAVKSLLLPAAAGRKGSKR